MGSKSMRMHYGPGENQLATPHEMEAILDPADLGRTALVRMQKRKQRRRAAGKAQRAARRRSRA